jgi:hypothetical protein
MGQSVGLMAVAGFAAVKTGVRQDRAVEAVGNFAGLHFSVRFRAFSVCFDPKHKKIGGFSLDSEPF